MSARALATALAVLALAVGGAVAASSLGRHHARHRPSGDLNSLINGAPLQRARCSNWLGASQADKALALRVLKASVGAPTEYRGLHGTTLSDQDAYRLFNEACARREGRDWLLYILYVRSAGMGGAKQTPPGL